MLIVGVDMLNKKSLNVEIGSRIKEARESAGLTQERFAELIGMGTKNVSAVERGTVGISLSSLKKICRILSVSSDQILFGAQFNNPSQELAERLNHLSLEQFLIAEDILNKLFEAFALGESK